VTLLLPTHLERTPAGDYLKVYADGRVLVHVVTVEQAAA